MRLLRLYAYFNPLNINAFIINMLPVTFISGDDDYIVNARAKNIFDELTKDIADDFGREAMDARCGKVEDVEKLFANFRISAQNLSLFGDKKVIWLRNLNFIADGQLGSAQGTKDLVADFQSFLEKIDPVSVQIVISASPVDRRRREFKWFKENCQSEDIEMNKGGQDVLLVLIREESKRHGIRFGQETALALIERVQGNSRLIVQEIFKLANYLGQPDATVTEKDIAEIVPTFGEGDFFELSEAFYAFDLEWTLEALRRYFFINKEARPLVTMLQNKNRLLLQLRVLLDANLIGNGRGVSSQELKDSAEWYKNHFPEAALPAIFTQNPFYLNRLLPVAKKLNTKKLIDFQLSFVQAFEELISRFQEQESVMRDLAIRCLA